MRDLIVAGGGPAGLATALYAARAGLDVEVWEPRDGAVEKPCGEGLMPGALTALAGLGVDPPGCPLQGIRYLAPGWSATASFSAGPGRGVRRSRLRHALLGAVRDAGVEVRARRVTEVRQRGDHVVVDGEPSAYLVAADGLHSPVRRLLGLDLPVRGPRRFGQRRHYRVSQWPGYVEVHWGGSAEAYVTPVDSGIVGVAVLSTERAGHERLLGGFPELRARLGDAVDDVRGAGPLRQRARRRVRGRVLLVGDAAGYVDALTGEGVALALAAARAAVAAVVAGEPERYERDWLTATRRYRWLTAALATATRPAPARRAIVPLAARLPAGFGAAVDALARPPRT